MISDARQSGTRPARAKQVEPAADKSYKVHMTNPAADWSDRSQRALPQQPPTSATICKPAEVPFRVRSRVRKNHEKAHLGNRKNKRRRRAGIPGCGHRENTLEYRSLSLDTISMEDRCRRGIETTATQPGIQEPHAHTRRPSTCPECTGTLMPYGTWYIDPKGYTIRTQCRACGFRVTWQSHSGNGPHA